MKDKKNPVQPNTSGQNLSRLIVILIFLSIIGLYFVFTNFNTLFQPAPQPKLINFETIAQSVQPCIVKVDNSGYGIIVHPRGYLLTTLDVINNKPQTSNFFVSSFTGKSYATQIVKIDKRQGLALLKVTAEPAADEFVPVESANPQPVKVGDTVIVPTDNGTVVGKITHLNKSVKIMDPKTQAGNPGGPRQISLIDTINYNGILLSDISLSSVYNGCPAFNQAGDIIGSCIGFSNLPIETGHMAGTSKNVYIVPISYAKPLLVQMSKLVPEVLYSKQGDTIIKWLGSSFIPQTEITGQSLTLSEITQDSIWAKFGMQAGDKIIKIENSPIAGLLDLENTLPALANYKKVNMNYVRNGKEKNVSIQISKVSLQQNVTVIPAIFIIILLGVVYCLVYYGRIDRTIIFVIGAILVTIGGYYLNFYDWPTAWDSLKSRLDVIAFIVGLNILTIILDEGGLFQYLARRIVLITKNNKWKIMLYFCLLTYVVSLFVNNLTTIMILIPMIFTLSSYLKFDPKPYIVGMIIASNLGGASTMVGDFPNIIISTEAGIGFSKFLIYMLPPCLLELVILLIYIRFSQKELFVSENKPKTSLFDDFPQLEEYFTPTRKTNTTVNMSSEQPAPNRGWAEFKNPEAVKTGLTILGIIIIGFLVCEFVGIPPAIIVLVGGVLSLFFCKVDIATVLEQLSYKDILFFSGLFIIVGAAEASGLLKLFGELIVNLSFGNILIRCILLMWIAGIITAFLNAGPATALMLPMVLSFNTPAPNFLYFWSLSLGVLAGSSATLTGATAGSVSANMLDYFIGSRAKKTKSKAQDQESGVKTLSLTTSYVPLSFKEYAKIGIPVSLIFLVASTIYVILIYQMGV